MWGPYGPYRGHQRWRCKSLIKGPVLPVSVLALQEPLDAAAAASCSANSYGGCTQAASAPGAAFNNQPPSKQA